MCVVACEGLLHIICIDCCLFSLSNVRVAVVWISDVPDAPTNLVLSEHKNRGVKLKWSPGEDHGSSTTGNRSIHLLCCTSAKSLCYIDSKRATAFEI